MAPDPTLKMAKISSQEFTGNNAGGKNCGQCCRVVVYFYRLNH